MNKHSKVTAIRKMQVKNVILLHTAINVKMWSVITWPKNYSAIQFKCFKNSVY